MGQLIDGQWSRADTIAAGSPDGRFHRARTSFRNWITPDGAAGPSGTGGFRAEAGRYHLYVSYACPWAHRTLIFRAIKGLAPLIDISVVHPDLLEDGWSFARDFDGTTGDRLHESRFLRDLYIRADPKVSTRVTVPVLWDRERATIVSNESADIIRMFNSAFDALTDNHHDYWPEPLRAQIETVNHRIYETVNNGVYRAGFATGQSAYDEAVTALFDTLDWLESHLAANRYLLGSRLTEADWRLFPTLARFDLVYHTHFKCNRRRLVDYPNLWAYARELHQWPGVAETVRPDHFVRHYYHSHQGINPHRIVPINPTVDFDAPHGRG